MLKIKQIKWPRIAFILYFRKKQKQNNAIDSKLCFVFER